MKHILVFNDSMQMGGTEKLLIDFLTHLIDKQCKVTLLLPQESSKDSLLTQINSNIEVQYIYRKDTSYLKRKCAEALLVFSPSLFNYFFKIDYNSYDSIICFKDSAYAPIFSISKTKKILWIHNILYRRQYEIRSLKERIAVWLNKHQLQNMYKAYKKYDSIICVSNACKDAFIDIVYEGNHPEDKVKMIHSGVNFDQITAQAKEESVELPDKTTNFALVTRNTPEKRTDRIISAAKRLNEEGYQFHVNIIGNVNTQDFIEEVRNKSLNNTITFHGQISNPLPYISKSDWLLCVSERESFGLTLLEAMALGVPVITTDCGGPSDIVNSGEFGLLVENSDEGVYRGMHMVLDNPSLSEHYKVIQKNALQGFNYKVWHNQIDTLLDL